MLAEMSAEPRAAALPRAPRTVQETGLPLSWLVELLAKKLFVCGQLRLAELSAQLKLNVSVLDALIVFLRAERLCEVTRRGGSGTDADLAYNLTDLGRTRAAEFMKHNAYCGPAPVTLAAYCAQVEAQSLALMSIMREDVAREFDNIVVSPVVLDQLGAAMNSRRAIFFHGAPGTGKTYLAERLSKLLKGPIGVPHAILVDGEVIQIHDPMVHRAQAGAAPASHAFDRNTVADARWVQCARPAVLTGGELTLAMLDLQFDPSTRFYQAPPHLKANNGIFIIDDLGRQRCSAAELMNRWIVPMDRHVDYLSLHTGHKFLVPFDVIVVFSSNAPPEQLADDSFLRRLGNKIHVGALTESEYERIFRQVCAQYETPYCGDALHYLLQQHHYKEGRALLACHPRDILTQVRDLARYQGKQPSLDEKTLDWAWNNCFIGS
jgi:MoxR-like ATPase